MNKKETSICLGISRFKKNEGFTLIEVIISLLIISVMASLGLGIYMEKYRSFFDTKREVEQEYSLFRGIQVICEAIRTAEKIEWSETGVLSIYQMDENTTDDKTGKIAPDKFYIDDKDHDGQTDLYREHLGVPCPVVSGIERIMCKEVSSELWEVRLSLRNSAEEDLRMIVRQRAVLPQ